MSKINTLRVEKRLLKSRLTSLEKNLDRGVVNTRKYQADSEKIQNIRNRLIEIESEFFLENQKLKKLKNLTINLEDSPLVQTMTQRTPPKGKGPDNNLNTTFGTLATETKTFGLPIIEDIIDDPPPAKQSRYDSEYDKSVKTTTIGEESIDIAGNGVQLKGAEGGSVVTSIGGALSKSFKQKENISLPIFSDQKSAMFPNQAIVQPSHSTVVTSKITEPISSIMKPLTIPEEDEDYVLIKRPRKSVIPEKKADHPEIKGNFDTPQYNKNHSKTIPLTSEITDLQWRIQALQEQLQKQMLDAENSQNNLASATASQTPRVQSGLLHPNAPGQQFNLEPQDDQSFEENLEHIQNSNQNMPRAAVAPQLQQQPGQNFNIQNFGNFQPNRDMPRDTFLRRLRSIPKFDGEGFAQLKEFIEVVDSLHITCMNQSEEDELSQQTLLQLRGEARNVIMTLKNTSWGSIKNKLLKYFNYLANKEILTSQLENIRQNKDESLSAYADRVRKLLRDKNATYASMTEEQKTEHNRVARKSFAKGITNLRLRDRLVTRGASSLEDAIAYAIEVENDDLNLISSNEMFCRICNQTGHLQKDCRRRNSERSEMNRLISALQSINGQNSQSQYNNVPLWIRNDWARRGGIYPPNQNQNNFRRPNFLNNNWNNGQNQGRNSNGNGNPNRNWNSNGNQVRNWNSNGNGNLNRNWNSNSNFPNQNGNVSSQNRNWNPNNFNQNRNWNNNQSPPPTWNRNNNAPNNGSNNGNNQSNYRNSANNQAPRGPSPPANRSYPNTEQRRSDERPRQNFCSTMPRILQPNTSSSESPTPEN